MQTMAGLNNDSEFLGEMAQEICRFLHDDRLDMGNYPFHVPGNNPFKIFKTLLTKILDIYPDKHFVLMIDEYEMLEQKFDAGQLNPEIINFWAGLLESERRLSFIFTGSYALEQRQNIEYWRVLFGKSIYRRVSLLSHDDARRLIIEPVRQLVTYDDKAVDAIYYLTAGQPFYTQVVCQNLIDHLNERRKNRVETAEVNTVTEEILRNPLPQMIYVWNRLAPLEKLAMAVLADLQQPKAGFISLTKIMRFVQQKKSGVQTSRNEITMAVESLCAQELVIKNKNEESYRIQIDLLRRWIRQDHSFWRIVQEITPSQFTPRAETVALTQFESQPRRRSNKLAYLVTAAAIIILGTVVAKNWIFQAPNPPEKTAEAVPPPAALPPRKDSSAVHAATEEKTPAEPAPTSMRAQKKQAAGDERKTSEPSALAAASAEERLATAARDSVVEKRFAAKAALAESFAKEDFRQGLELEAEGDRARERRDFTQAKSFYENATSYFDRAKTSSAEMAALTKEIEGFKNKISQSKTKIMVTAIEQEEKRGNDAISAGNLVEALAHYKNAYNFHLGRVNLINALAFVPITGGTFTIGSNAGRLDEQPPSETRVNGFQMSKYEVTNSNYAVFLNSEGNQTEERSAWIALKMTDCLIEKDGEKFRAKPGFENYPVTYVTWFGAKAFCNWVEGRLPTEAEWEYACRAGKPTPYFFGDDPQRLPDFAWHKGRSDDQMHPVGRKIANDFGLHDMLGNVWEWCADWYDPKYYAKKEPDNPKGPSQGEYRVLRGGGFNSESKDCRVSTRNSLVPFDRYNFVGFRVVR